MNTRNLPLTIATPDRWADAALSDIDALLVDHAHLERKAAANALELCTKWPEGIDNTRWVATMNDVAKDEVQHLKSVCRILSERRVELKRQHRNLYAKHLRSLIRKGNSDENLVDKLLISALIEARSCERFEILSRRCEQKKLSKLYGSLWASEHGHYTVFLELSYLVQSNSEVDKRWRKLLAEEARILQEMPPGPSMHSWI